MELIRIYDEAFDLMNLTVKEDFVFLKTVEIQKGFCIDFKVGDGIAAIEMLNFSKKFRVTRKVFGKVKMDGLIRVSGDVISVEITVYYMDDARVFKKEIPNDYGISSNEFSFSIPSKLTYS